MARKYRRKVHSEDIPQKANRVLNLVLIGILIIVLRVWHLGVVQHEERLEESRRPQKKTLIEPAKRGTIRDRFNIPLAINKVKYQAAVLYSEIREIPAVKWELVEGKKVKRNTRREHIAELSDLLGQELNLDSERIEDLIHSKASLYNNLPFLIKEDLTEEQYYRLKMLEKDWVGLCTQIVPKRDYPLGRVACDIIGYTGAISRQEYEKIIEEIKTLESALGADDRGEVPLFPPGIDSKEIANLRLNDLIEHAYRASDHVGKTGIEARFEEDLRGYYGKKTYYSDARGNFLREHPGSKAPLSGHRFLLSISSELQQFAEELLIQNENVRIPRVTGVKNSDERKLTEKHPWIKGGAIVAMDPSTGDLLAFASFPRFDPNDFIPSGNSEIAQVKHANIRRWFETEDYIGEIWDKKRPLQREIFDVQKEKIYEEEAWLSWERFLDFILPKSSPIFDALKKVKSVRDAINVQVQAENLMSLTQGTTLYPVFNSIYAGGGHVPHGPRLPAVQQEDLEEMIKKKHADVLIAKEQLDPYFLKLTSNYDKVLFVDICRLVAGEKSEDEAITALFGNLSLSSYRDNNAAWTILERSAKQMTKELYREVDFKKWRQENQKAFLKEKREEEKMLGIKYPKPYLDLVDKKEEALFAEFWEKNKWCLLHTFLTGMRPHSESNLDTYFHFFECWERELSQGAHNAIEWRAPYETLRKTLLPLTPDQSLAFTSSFRSFSDLTRPLLGKYRYMRKEGNLQLEKHLAAAFYPSFGFGYGRSHCYRQAATQGSIFKLVTGYEALIQAFRKNEHSRSLRDLNPFVMVDDTHKKGKAVFVGYDQAGKDIPQLYKGGRIPRSHRSGMGKVDFLKAFEISSNPYFSLLAIDFLESPNDLSLSAENFCFGSKTGIDLPSEISGRVPQDLDYNRNGLYAMAIGQHSMVVTPLQTAVMMAAIANGGKKLKPKILNMIIGKDGVKLAPREIVGEVEMPEEVQKYLVEAMRRVSKRTLLSAWGSLSELYHSFPEAISDLIDIKDELIGKSSTSESVENIDLDLEKGTSVYNHTWFGGIVYDKELTKSKQFLFRDSKGKPELVVVVYLRYGAWGKDTVPLAAQIAKKWREIKEKHKADLL